MAMHDPHYLVRARELCSRYGVHLIADEIMTGFGRTARSSLRGRRKIAPDFLLLSKGITVLPALACVLSTTVFASFYDDDITARLPATRTATLATGALRGSWRGSRSSHLPDDSISANRRGGPPGVSGPVPAPLAGTMPKVRNFGGAA